MKIFISYSSKNYDIAKEICDYIEANGGSCFIAPRDIRSGYSYAEEIMRGLDSAEGVLLLLSTFSNESVHVFREVERAVGLGIPILTYKLEEVNLSKSLEYFLMPFQWLDSKDDQKHAPLLAGLQGMISGQSQGNGQTYGNNPAPMMVGNHAANKEQQKLKAQNRMLLCGIFLIACVALIGIIGILRKPSSGISETPGASQSETGVVSEEPAEEPQAFLETVEVGEKVVFGSYLGEPIVWRVLGVDEQGNAEMITQDVITMKCFDAAESGVFYQSKEGKDFNFNFKDEFTDGEMMEMFGSNRWSTSNLRTWLNSSAEVPEYNDQAPVCRALSEGRKGNDYHLEEGFLFFFSEEDRNALVKVKNVTKLASFYGEQGEEDLYEETEDYVYLPSLEDLSKIKNAGFSIYANPTEVAIEQNKSELYQVESLLYDTDNIFWWLRDAVEDSSHRVQIVLNGLSENMEIDFEVASVDGVGVRPVVTVNLQSGQVKEYK